MQFGTEELRAAVLNAMAAALNAEVAGMQAENAHRISNGLSVAYTAEAFDEAITKHSLGHNGVSCIALRGEMP